MSDHFANKLLELGFNRDDSTIREAVEIQQLEVVNFLADPSVFIPRATRVTRNPENLGELISCELICAANTELDQALEFILVQWINGLRLPDPRYENIEIHRENNASASIRCITAGTDSACTFHFSVQTYDSAMKARKKAAGDQLLNTGNTRSDLAERIKMLYGSIELSEEARKMLDDNTPDSSQ